MVQLIDFIVMIGIVLLVLVLGIWNLAVILKGLTFEDFKELLGIEKIKEQDNEKNNESNKTLRNRRC